VRIKAVQELRGMGRNYLSVFARTAAGAAYVKDFKEAAARYASLTNAWRRDTSHIQT
jgi:hypothetical protein